MAKGGRSPVSGWIKFEKRLREDIRVKRMARALPQILPGLCNGSPLHGVTVCLTVVLGALAQIWMHADTFARADDTLDLTAEEIDELVGIEDFSTILPPDWFELIDGGRVKLPNYQAHNGPEAKEKALTALRVAKFRANHGNGGALQHGDDCNGDALPDQTRLDQTRHTQEARASSVPRETNPTPPPPRVEVVDEEAREILEAFREGYPRGIYRESDWLMVEREIRARLEDGATRQQILDGRRRYAEQVRAKGGEGTQFVMSPLRFMRERQYLEPFPVPQKPPSPQQTRADRVREELDRLKARRAELGIPDFREPTAVDTPETYETALRLAARDRRDVNAGGGRATQAIRDLAAAKRVAS